GKPKPGAKPQPYIRAPFNQTLGRFSPDMRWVAYQSDDSGRNEVYVDSFPEAHKKVQISTAGGRYPEWRRDGQELFYVSLDDKLMAVTMKLGPDSNFAARTFRLTRGHRRLESVRRRCGRPTIPDVGDGRQGRALDRDRQLVKSAQKRSSRAINLPGRRCFW